MLEVNNGNFTIFKPNSDHSNIPANFNDIRCLLDAQTAIKFEEYRQRYKTPQKMEEDLTLFAKTAGSVSNNVILLYSPTNLSNS